MLVSNFRLSVVFKYLSVNVLYVFFLLFYQSLIGIWISLVWFSASDYFSRHKGNQAKPLIRPVPLSARLFEDKNKKKEEKKKRCPLLAFGPPRITVKGHYSQNRQLIPLATIGSSFFPHRPSRCPRLHPPLAIWNANTMKYFSIGPCPSAKPPPRAKNFIDWWDHRHAR